MTSEQPQPTEEELRAFEEQLRRVSVPDVLVQNVVMLINVGGQKLGEDGDLEQAKLAIEGARALLPLLPEEVQTPIRDALSQLQMAYVRESQGGGGEQQQQQAQQPDQPEQPQQAGDEAERAKARSKIWTPPGT
ncbi:MAG: hypothetical protein M3340_08730 [Actinomycetota bacterium]|nr:hypothetical protein [Actinomycetota bacterium]